MTVNFDYLKMYNKNKFELITLINNGRKLLDESVFTKYEEFAIPVYKHIKNARRAYMISRDNAITNYINLKLKAMKELGLEAKNYEFLKGLLKELGLEDWTDSEVCGICEAKIIFHNDMTAKHIDGVFMGVCDDCDEKYYQKIKKNIQDKLNTWIRLFTEGENRKPKTGEIEEEIEDLIEDMGEDMYYPFEDFTY